MSNRKNETGCWTLATRLFHLLHSWWRRDAIRVSPAEGRLLRLAPPCWLLIDEQPVEVMGRTVLEQAGTCFVTYYCWTGSSLGKLTVAPGAATARWQLRDAVAAVPAAAIEVYSP